MGALVSLEHQYHCDDPAGPCTCEPPFPRPYDAQPKAVELRSVDVDRLREICERNVVLERRNAELESVLRSVTATLNGQADWVNLKDTMTTLRTIRSIVEEAR